MSIKQEMVDALNEQINAEFYSAYLYLSMAAWFEDKNLGGFASWFRSQYLEENTHGMRIFNFVNERGGRILLKPVAEPEKEWNSIIEIFEQVAEHEAHVTELIHNLIAMARSMNDYATESFLMFFVDEQVEEEASVGDLLAKLKLIGDSKNALFQMDGYLKKRMPAPDTIPVHLGQKSEN